MKQLDIKEHFLVPEGYFDGITDRLMALVPEHETKPMHLHKRSVMPRIAAAVVAFVVLSFSVTMYFLKNADEGVVAQPEQMSPADDDDIYTVEEAAHYTMIDNTKLHYMITEL